VKLSEFLNCCRKNIPVLSPYNIVFLLTLFSSTNATSKNKYTFSVESTYHYSSQFILAPQFGLLIDHSNLYIGPVFQFSKIENVYDQNAFKLGYSYFFNDEHKPVSFSLGLEYEVLQYKYDTKSYDYAYPNIPIQATIVHEKSYQTISLLSGARYYFTKRFFLHAKAGMAVVWQDSIDPDDIYRFYDINSYERSNVLLRFQLLLAIGFVI
jgi:hypothetical protein